MPQIKMIVQENSKININKLKFTLITLDDLAKSRIKLPNKD